MILNGVNDETRINNHDGKCSVFFARGSAVDLDGTADRLSLCAASDPQG